MQIQPGEYGAEGEAAVVAKVNAALARFQHSTDKQVLELWSKLCVHRAALRDGIARTGGSATHTDPPGPPVDSSARGGAGQDFGEHDTTGLDSPVDAGRQRMVVAQQLPNHDEHRQQQAAAQQYRLAERRRQWAAESSQV
eukprot:COSAG02_NODE_20406_length_833_cov_1.126703_1_plen_140_part_00